MTNISTITDVHTIVAEAQITDPVCVFPQQAKPKMVNRNYHSARTGRPEEPNSHHDAPAVHRPSTQNQYIHERKEPHQRRYIAPCPSMPPELHQWHALALRKPLPPCAWVYNLSERRRYTMDQSRLNQEGIDTPLLGT